MYILTIKEEEIVGFKIKEDNYQLQDNDVEVSQEDFDNFTTNFMKPIYVNGNVVENATEEEIDAINSLNQLNELKSFNDKVEQDGLQFYNEIKLEITKLLIGKTDAMSLMVEIKNTVYPMLNVIKDGNFPLAIIDFTDENNTPTNPIVLDLFNKVGQKAIQYYADEYPH